MDRAHAARPPRDVAGRPAHARARSGHRGPGRGGVPQRGQARSRRAPLPRTDRQRRGMRTLDHLRRPAHAHARRRDHGRRSDHAPSARQPANPRRHRREQAGSHRRDAGRCRQAGFRGRGGAGADDLPRRRRQAADPHPHRQGSAVGQAFHRHRHPGVQRRHGAGAGARRAPWRTPDFAPGDGDRPRTASAELRSADRHADARADRRGRRARRHHWRGDGWPDDGRAAGVRRRTGGQGHQLRAGAVGRAVPAPAAGIAMHPLHPLRRRVPRSAATAGTVPLRQGR